MYHVWPIPNFEIDLVLGSSLTLPIFRDGFTGGVGGRAGVYLLKLVDSCSSLAPSHPTESRWINLRLFVISRLVVDFSIVTWAFGNVSVVVVTWILMQLQVIMAYPLFMAWVSTRASAPRVLDLIWLTVFLVYLAVLFMFPLNEIWSNQLPPVSRTIIIMEQVSLSN